MHHAYSLDSNLSDISFFEVAYISPPAIVKPMKPRILYGSANYEEIVGKNGYFVDKTNYIKPLENINNPVFLRPRRFGKSLWCSILECYYDINRKNDFDRLFGTTWIGQHPTPNRNAYSVLRLDFSVVDPTGSLEDIERCFDNACNADIEALITRSFEGQNEHVGFSRQKNAGANLKSLSAFITSRDLPPLYILIDEYDNFANQLITAHKDDLYRRLTADDSFLKTFFKTIKAGRGSGAIANVFITGVLPITMDDLSSGFNIATYITLDQEFEGMLGFTQRELSNLLDELYADYQLDPATRAMVCDVMRRQYDGYHFVNPEGESLYNSTLVMYFLTHLTRHGAIPEYLTDMNLKTDLSWVKRITSTYEGSTEEFVDKLTQTNRILYDRSFLVNQFNMSQFFEKGFFPISFFYLGMLTRHDDFYMRIPNLNMQTIFVQYFNELHHIDVSTQYGEIMSRFIRDLDVEALFHGYWEHYVSQLPEAVFAQMNENFYRITFMELCSRYLSKWFTFNVERSYPQGRSDLEFAGKFSEKFAHVRIVCEFKYLSNDTFAKYKTTPESFPLQAEDAEQLAGYVEGLKQEYPEVEIPQYVIYCFGNIGCRVFRV